jgi:RNA polymerase sigma-70 factor (ECF subfamily)
MDKTETRIANEAKLASLYEEFYDKISRYIFTHIGKRAEAEDLAGEVFLKALENLNSYEQRDVPMSAWLYRIAHNLTVDYLRKTAKRKTVSIEDIEIESGEDIEKTVEQNIEMERVNKAMEQLTSSQREVVRLRFFGGLTSREVGQLLNKSDGAVREMQRAAMESLRQLLSQEE